MKRVHLFTLMICVFCAISKGQDIKSVVMAGAPNRLVRNFMQDRKGNIWMATHGGVFRYDGKSFTNITSGVSSDRIHSGLEDRFYAVIEDRKGNFWFGSIDTGVYFYDGKSFIHYTTKDGLVNDRIAYIYEDKKGILWFGTMGGLSRYDGKSFQTFTTKDGLSHNEITTIAEDKSGKLWVGTRGGASIYDREVFTIKTRDSGAAFSNVRSIIEDSKGNIWLGGSNGLWRYDGRSFTNYTTNFVADIIEDKKGNIWICSEKDNGRGWAVSHYDAAASFTKKITLTETDTASIPIMSIFEDTNGNTWIGEFGVRRFDGKSITVFESNSH